MYCALQDRRGFLWFGTKYGLNRFDGIRFYTYRLNDGNASTSLLSDEILALAEDAEGRIWIGTSAGLCVYRPETDCFSRYATPAWENGVKVDNLVMDGQDNLWVTSADGVCCIRAETGECSLFPSSRFFLPTGIVDGCMKRLRKDPGQEENENLQIMQRNTDRLLNLVNQLLDFRKIESTNLLMHCVRLNARMLLENVCRNFTYMRSGEIPISFRADPDNEDYWVTADTEALVKIISNMLSNAMKFGERKVDVSISRCLAKDVETVRIRVSNDGPLIPAAERKRIFEPFHQYFGKHSKATIQGTGLGLPLARSLAEMNNASFYLDDQDTGSNSFVLDIPACGADERSDTPDDGLLADADGCAKDASGKAADRNTVLVVDDEPDMCRFVSSVMEGDYHVLVAHNGREAVAVLDKNIVSLIVTDVMMPVMDGIVLCQTVKSNIKYCHIPIVILTAKVSMQSHLEALEAKADAYIEKPFVAEHLLAQVRNLLLNRELLRETFVKSPYARMATVGLNRLDEEFLDKLNDYIICRLMCWPRR